VETDPLAPGPGRDRAVRDMFDRIADRYDLVNRVLTFGLDGGWRRRAVASLGLPPGSLVLDVGCGTGGICRLLTRAGHRCVGIDPSEGMLRAAAPGVRLVLGDGLRLPVADGAADGITCGFALRNVVDPAALFAEFGRVLRPGGRLALLEVAEPRWRPARALHHTYFHRVVPAVGGALSDRGAYRYLPESTSLLPAPDRLHAMLRDAGFIGFRRRLLGLGAAQLVDATRLTV
jgi:demethylmenaquinone methyltransferase/2-methoxy-6-polyprenyl-1,4-benzoquinol methylase